MIGIVIGYGVLGLVVLALLVAGSRDTVREWEADR